MSLIIVLISVVPDNYITYPLTETRHVAPLTHDTEVCIGKSSLIRLAGSKTFTEQNGLGIYHFPLKLDVFAFQSAVRGKLLRHVFDVDYVNSERGRETTQQHLKLWSDTNDENHMLSFFIKQKKGPDTFLEFPCDCFVPRLKPSHIDPSELRIYFRIQPKKAKNKQRSTDSVPRVSSPPDSLSYGERHPSTNARSASSSHSRSPSFLSMFSSSRRPSDTSQSAGSADPRCRYIMMIKEH